MSKAWEVLSSRVVHDRRPWLVLQEEHVRLPNGVEIPDYILTQEPDAAVVLAITSDNQVPLIEQYRHGIGQLLLDLPAGLPLKALSLRPRPIWIRPKNWMCISSSSPTC